MIRSIHSPLNTPGSPQSKPSNEETDHLVDVLDDKSDMDEVGDSGAMAVLEDGRPCLWRLPGGLARPVGVGKGLDADDPPIADGQE